jgi:glucose/arabinose dehydrogenase
MMKALSRSKWGLALLAFGALGMGASWSALPKNITFVDAFDGKVTFDSPVFFGEVPGKPGHFVVLEQNTGNVIIVAKANGEWAKSVMFNVKVGNANEMGLLGIAFHPDYPTNGRYYLSYNPTTDSSLVVERMADASLIKDAGNPSVVVIALKQPASNHNGGMIGFNPKEGKGKNYLYAGFGDGGGSGDTYKNSRKKNVFFAKMLRVNIDSSASGKNYVVPFDNPFVNNAEFSPEIWAWGLRNPWRWSFDPLNGDLWVGDVGQNAWEEIDIVPKGADMGWNAVEGTHCYGTATCDQTGMTAPIAEYSHTNTGSCVIGGPVYRGNPSSPFYGAYFYADNSTRIVQVIDYKDGKVVENTNIGKLTESPTSFGSDLAGNVYIVGREGHVYRLTSPDLIPSTTPLKRLQQEKSIRCCMNQKGKRLHLQGDLDASMAGLDLFDSQGKKVATHTSAEIRTGISLSLVTGVYHARAHGEGVQASVQFAVQ